MDLNDADWALACGLLGLLLLMAWLVAIETALLALNPLRHRQRLVAGDLRGARVQKLIEKLETVQAFAALGRASALVSLTMLLTLAGLAANPEPRLLALGAAITGAAVLFGFVVPRALGSRFPGSIARAGSGPLLLLVWLTRPLTALLGSPPRRLLCALAGSAANEMPTPEGGPFRAAMRDAGAHVPQRHRDMLLGLLDLASVTVEDIMVPRAEIVGVDLEQEWMDIVEQLTTCRHTRIPCYYGNIDEIAGILHLRNLSRLLRQSRDFTLDDVVALLTPPHFVPLKANLYSQLINFQLARQRMGVVVDEYGDIQGMVTLDDLLGQVVGEFTTMPQFDAREVYPQADGSYVVEGTANVRELNRAFGWSLPENGPKTLNGLILEALEDIPEAGTSFRLDDYTIEIVQGAGHTVRNARIFPPAGLVTRNPGDKIEPTGC